MVFGTMGEESTLETGNIFREGTMEEKTPGMS